MPWRSRNGVNQFRDFEVFRKGFFERLVSEGDCLVWTGEKYPSGHGSIGFHGVLYRTHRIAWVLAYGTIPPGMLVCHKCDNPPCCKPEHLFLGTDLDNVRDAKAKGRMITGYKNPNRPRGASHGMAKLSEENVMEIRERARHGEKPTQIARIFLVTNTCICDIVHRKTWRNLP